MKANNTIPYKMEREGGIYTPVIYCCENKYGNPFFECHYKSDGNIKALDWGMQEVVNRDIIFSGSTIQELIENIDSEVSQEEFPFEVSYYYGK